MFRASMCPSSGEITVSLRHLVFVTLWMTVWCALHTRQSSTHSDKYQVSHWYSYFSWWWAHSCPKHVENRNKYTRKIVHQVGFIYKIMHLKYLWNLARYWLQVPWGWHDSVETRGSVIICEIILHLIVIVQNIKVSRYMYKNKWLFLVPCIAYVWFLDFQNK